MKITIIKPEDVKRGRRRSLLIAESRPSRDQEDSFESQVTYYETDKQPPELTRWRIYADQGKSGTKTENRPEFMRMIDDAMSRQDRCDLLQIHLEVQSKRSPVPADRERLKTKMVEVIFEESSYHHSTR